MILAEFSLWSRVVVFSTEESPVSCGPIRTVGNGRPNCFCNRIITPNAPSDCLRVVLIPSNVAGRESRTGSAFRRTLILQPTEFFCLTH